MSSTYFNNNTQQHQQGKPNGGSSEQAQSSHYFNPVVSNTTEIHTSGKTVLNSVAKNPVQRSLCCDSLSNANNDAVEHPTNEMPSVVKNNTWNGGTTSGYFNMPQVSSNPNIKNESTYFNQNNVHEPSNYFSPAKNGDASPKNAPIQSEYCIMPGGSTNASTYLALKK